MPSAHFRSLSKEIKTLGRLYLNFAARPAGDYTARQLSSSAAYTLFCHAEFENYFERWAGEITDIVETSWNSKKATKPLVHLCAFLDARPEVQAIPSKDVWSEPIVLAIKRQRAAVKANHGIKEQNICRLFAPLGYDVRTIDAVLLGDLDAFGSLRGDYAHGPHGAIVKSGFDPFARKVKAEALMTSIQLLDHDLVAFRDAV
ncbi:hypothetical protein EXN61_21835 [Agrobacterium tumefaciens]|uniref:RiboL-PSP-HEPN domain-containing protein n=1 Tax=Agrobacterium tumefaciens TaxID=358 RepID=A0A546XRY7_AGRTU|nr:hypothetical protein [Agrobacterium tumefaciens]TRB03503.1 hypothetical protein EXN61_21835 [Agrobacterium tumefaciens]